MNRISIHRGALTDVQNEFVGFAQDHAPVRYTGYTSLDSRDFKRGLYTVEDNAGILSVRSLVVDNLTQPDLNNQSTWMRFYLQQLDPERLDVQAQLPIERHASDEAVSPTLSVSLQFSGDMSLYERGGFPQFWITGADQSEIAASDKDACVNHMMGRLQILDRMSALVPEL